MWIWLSVYLWNAHAYSLTIARLQPKYQPKNLESHQPRQVDPICRLNLNQPLDPAREMICSPDDLQACFLSEAAGPDGAGRMTAVSEASRPARIRRTVEGASPFGPLAGSDTRGTSPQALSGASGNGRRPCMSGGGSVRPRSAALRQDGPRAQFLPSLPEFSRAVARQHPHKECGLLQVLLVCGAPPGGPGRERRLEPPPARPGRVSRYSRP